MARYWHNQLITSERKALANDGGHDPALEGNQSFIVTDDGIPHVVLTSDITDWSDQHAASYTKMLNGKSVTVLRAAVPEDEGFVRQTLVRHEDGSEKVVPTADLKGKPAGQGTVGATGHGYDPNAKPVAPGPPVAVNHDYDAGSQSFIKGQSQGTGFGATGYPAGEARYPQTSDDARKEQDRQAAINADAAKAAASGVPKPTTTPPPNATQSTSPFAPQPANKLNPFS